MKDYRMYSSIYMKFWKKQNCSERKLINDYQGAGDKMWVSSAKGHEGKFWGNGNVLYHFCSGSYTTLYICPNSMNYTLKIAEFLDSINYMLIKLIQ